ncbi:TRIM3 [Branchiostoma lanceolatum]|uniref:TRIM3 protein n=1 Tax=Branchiostoma lanceolatum TaxID=7740 RepID=A0A8J9ZXN6_BRALA|nr:TRIM3 [Branchiostoma lanceolatum]
MRALGKGRLAEEAEQLEQQQRGEGGESEGVKKEITEHSFKRQEEQQKLITKADTVQSKNRKDELIREAEEKEKGLQQLPSKNAGNRTLAGCESFQPSSQSQVLSASLLESAGMTISVEGPAVESLPCSVTVTDTADRNVAPQIEVTSPKGKTTLLVIHTTAHTIHVDSTGFPPRPHTSPPLAAGKGQTGRVRRVWGGEWKHTLGVCMGGKKDLGSLTIDVGSNNPVLRFGRWGSQQGQFSLESIPSVAPRYLYGTTDGTIVVNSGNEVKKFSPSGELLHRFPLGEYCTIPWGLAVQRDGRVVVADIVKHNIFLFEADGTLVKQVGGRGQFDEPWFVCVDKEDNIIVADKENDRVQVFYKNLNFQHKFGQKGRQPQDMSWPTGVSVDSRGNIVLANLGGEKLQVFWADGTWLSNISSDGDKLNMPHGVAVKEDVYVYS